MFDNSFFNEIISFSYSNVLIIISLAPFLSYIFWNEASKYKGVSLILIIKFSTKSLIPNNLSY